MGWFCLKGFSHQLKQPDNHADVLLRSLEKDPPVGFEEKPLSEQRDILKYLSINWKNLQQDSSVIAALAETDFVTGSDGHLYKPKELFDPGDALLKSLFSDKIPGKRFVSDRWLNILRKTGLQNIRDADTVIRCARRIEFLGAQSMKDDTKGQVSIEVWSLAETLIEIIFGNSTLLQDRNFCSEFGKIACVPAEKGFPLETNMRQQKETNMRQQKETNMRQQKVKKRVVCSYNEAILLKDWPLAWSAAPIVSKDPPDYSWGALQLRSPPPFTLVLKHLQIQRKGKLFSMAHYSTLEEATLHVLKYLDANWSSLSSSDVSNLSKLAFIPSPVGAILTSASHNFTHLTINAWPIAHELPLCYLPFIKILKELGLRDKLSISSAATLLSLRRRYLLNPNELRAVIALLNFICDEIQQHKSDRSNWKSLLVVPDIECRLVRPNSCVYMDPFGSQYLKYIDSSKLRLVHHDVPERVCLAFGIRKLSDVVVEQLDRVEHLQTLEEIGSVSLAAIRLKLLSRSFRVAVSSVVSNFSSITSGFRNPDFQTLQRSLDYVAERLQFVQSIYTRFRLLPDFLDITLASMDCTIPEWESESSHRALYYVDRSYTCMLIAEPPSYVSVIDLVAIVVSHVLGFPVTLPIGSLLLCPQDSETELFNILRVSSDEREKGHVLIGGEIVPQDALQVQLKPLRPFYRGEIVAWKSQNGDNLLKYGRIVEDARPSSEKTLYKLSIETSPLKIETMISSHVFWFGSSSMTCKSSTYRHAVKEHKHGCVPANKFVQAVERMLSLAGINVDSDKHRHQNVMLLQGQLNESQAELVLEQEKSQIAREEVHTAETDCRICLTSEIDVTIVPCGHALCRQCSSHISRCPFCRLQVYSYQNIHSQVLRSSSSKDL